MTMRTRFLQQLSLWTILFHPTVALIVSPLPTNTATRGSAGNSIDTCIVEQKEQAVSIARIRTTKRSDVESVADLLSLAIAGDGSTSLTNFKAKMDHLRVKTSVQANLDSRVKAIQEGKKHLTQAVDAVQGDSIYLRVHENPDHLRYLWSKDSFRNKVAQAAKLSTEPHPWEHHDFNLAPTDACWLQHEMITAECTTTNKIVGFCEIAMLLRPTRQQQLPASRNTIDFVNGDDYAEDESDPTICMQCCPTIANLVVSLDWRRRGIAKGLLRSAERLVRRKWRSNELALYVEKRNLGAIRLYSDSGYLVQSSLTEQQDEPHSHKWYMSKTIC